jgi:hypothetical protein
MKPRHDRIGGYRAGAVPPHAKRRRVERFAGKQLPPKVDLRPFLTEVEDQVGNSCVANAFAGAYEYLAKRARGEAGDVSRLFIYYNARAEMGEEGGDQGATMNAAIEALKKYGACREELWPNDEDAINDEPPPEAYDHAANFTITEAEFIETNLDLWRGTLAEGYPIAFSVNTFDSFDDATDNRGRVPLPKKSDQARDTHGWHAMLCVGYLDKDQMFIVRNSWSGEWGDGGYCYIPYKYLMNRELNGHDSWLVKSLSDTDFSRDIASDDEGSYFAADGSLQFFDFYVATGQVDEFAEALAELCRQYTDEDGFYFDYEESQEEGVTYTYIDNFDIAVEDPEQFLDDLDALCEEWAEDDEYDFQIEGYDEPEADPEEAVAIEFAKFWIYTEDAEKVADKIDRLCAKYALDGDDFDFEWAEDEDEDGAYIELTDFSINTDDPDGFLEKLETLCEKYTGEGGYEWDTV